MMRSAALLGFVVLCLVAVNANDVGSSGGEPGSWIGAAGSTSSESSQNQANDVGLNGGVTSDAAASAVAADSMPNPIETLFKGFASILQGAFTDKADNIDGVGAQEESARAEKPNESPIVILGNVDPAELVSLTITDNKNSAPVGAFEAVFHALSNADPTVEIPVVQETNTEPRIGAQSTEAAASGSLGELPFGLSSAVPSGLPIDLQSLGAIIGSGFDGVYGSGLSGASSSNQAPATGTASTDNSTSGLSAIQGIQLIGGLLGIINSAGLGANGSSSNVNAGALPDGSIGISPPGSQVDPNDSANIGNASDILSGLTSFLGALGNIGGALSGSNPFGSNLPTTIDPSFPSIIEPAVMGGAPSTSENPGISSASTIGANFGGNVADLVQAGTGNGINVNGLSAEQASSGSSVSAVAAGNSGGAISSTTFSLPSLPLEIPTNQLIGSIIPGVSAGSSSAVQTGGKDIIIGFVNGEYSGGNNADVGSDQISSNERRTEAGGNLDGVSAGSSSPVQTGGKDIIIGFVNGEYSGGINADVGSGQISSNERRTEAGGNLVGVSAGSSSAVQTGGKDIIIGFVNGEYSGGNNADVGSGQISSNERRTEAGGNLFGVSAGSSSALQTGGKDIIIGFVNGEYSGGNNADVGSGQISSNERRTEAGGNLFGGSAGSNSAPKTGGKDIIIGFINGEYSGGNNADVGSGQISSNERRTEAGGNFDGDNFGAQIIPTFILPDIGAGPSSSIGHDSSVVDAQSGSNIEIGTELTSGQTSISEPSSRGVAASESPASILDVPSKTPENSLIRTIFAGLTDISGSEPTPGSPAETAEINFGIQGGSEDVVAKSNMNINLRSMAVSLGDDDAEDNASSQAHSAEVHGTDVGSSAINAGGETLVDAGIKSNHDTGHDAVHEDGHSGSIEGIKNHGIDFISNIMNGGAAAAGHVDGSISGLLSLAKNSIPTTINTHLVSDIIGSVKGSGGIDEALGAGLMHGVVPLGHTEEVNEHSAGHSDGHTSGHTESQSGSLNSPALVVVDHHSSAGVAGAFESENVAGAAAIKDNHDGLKDALQIDFASKTSGSSTQLGGSGESHLHDLSYSAIVHGLNHVAEHSGSSYNKDHGHIESHDSSSAHSGSKASAPVSTKLTAHSKGSTVGLKGSIYSGNLGVHSAKGEAKIGTYSGFGNEKKFGSYNGHKKPTGHGGYNSYSVNQKNNGYDGYSQLHGYDHHHHHDHYDHHGHYDHGHHDHDHHDHDHHDHHDHHYHHDHHDHHGHYDHHDHHDYDHYGHGHGHGHFNLHDQENFARSLDVKHSGDHDHQHNDGLHESSQSNSHENGDDDDDDDDDDVIILDKEHAKGSDHHTDEHGKVTRNDHVHLDHHDIDHNNDHMQQSDHVNHMKQSDHVDNEHKKTVDKGFGILDFLQG